MAKNSLGFTGVRKTPTDGHMSKNTSNWYKGPSLRWQYESYESRSTLDPGIVGSFAIPIGGAKKD